MASTAHSGRSTANPVVPVHANVPGRARLDVPGLYRSPALKAHLEKQLALVGAVNSVDANTRTGRILVIYKTEAPLSEVIRAIEQLLAIDARPRQRHHRKKAGFRVYRMAPVLDSITAILRTPAEMLNPAPVFGAVAGAAAAAMGAQRQAQEIFPWHLMTPQAVLDRLGVSDHGLDGGTAGERLRRFGENSLEAVSRRSDFSIFIGQFNSLPVALLGASAGISLVTGGAADAAVILGVVLINAAIGFVTERKAELTINSLSKSGVSEVDVLRGGVTTKIPVVQIVPGDILILSPGSYISADVRLLRSHRMSVDESALTGESLPVSKDHEFAAGDDTPLADRRNMAYMGTHVTGGNGRGVVIATAATTELGQIQTMVGEAEAPDTPMQKQLDSMGTQLALLSGAVCAGVFAVGLLRGFGWMEMLKSSVSLAVAAVPEGLPAVATTTLAMGIADMRKHNVSVRHLDAVESLGSVQMFCMDKTGTLTMNRMAVVALHSGQAHYAVAENRILNGDEVVDPNTHDELIRLMQVVSLCSETEVHGPVTDYKLEGSATENALVDLAIGSGIDVGVLRTDYPKLRTRYRAEGRPYMTTLHPYRKGKHLLAVKGSPEEVLDMCTHQYRGGKKVRLSQSARKEILEENSRMAGDALRVLGVAYRELDSDRMPSKTASLTWLGLAGMADPMRAGMDKLIAMYHRAGIETIMITGDQSGTAFAIGQQLGLSKGRPLQVLESSQLDDIDPDLLAALLKNTHVFARVSPAHKLKIVQALQSAGYVVAMTGDGINDGPALKAADIGVAMGKSGTNVARDVSDVVLEDDNLHTMSTAIRQGRTIYNNIRKTIHFMVSTNLTEIEVMLAGIALGLGQPMNPMQLLWINLVTDIFPGLALSLEPAEPDIMDRPPRDPKDKIISGKDLKRMTFESGVIGVGTMAAYLYGLKRYGNQAAASTLAFNTLTLNELAHALSSRSKYQNVFGGQKLPPNPHLTRAILGMAGLQAVVSLVPALRRMLGTTPLGLMDLGVIAAGVVLPLIVNEGTKPKAPTRAADDDGVDEDNEATEEKLA